MPIEKKIVIPPKYGEGPSLVRRWRRMRGMTLLQLSSLLGYSSHQALQRYEIGMRLLPLEKLKRLAQLMSVDVKRLAAREQIAEIEGAQK